MPAPSLLLGRDGEIAQLRVTLDRAPEHGSVVLVRGAAGIGKTSLLAAALADARSRGYRVLIMTGVESEAQLPYAGLHQLLHPVIGQVESLPAPQQKALKTALGMTADEAPEMFLVALATLNLVESVAGDQPIVIVADDAQWLDGPTVGVLTFIARRVEPTNTLILAGIRDGDDNLLLAAHLPELRVDALTDTASRELLDTVAPGLDRRIRQQVLDDAIGNPLALIELPRAVNAARQAPQGRLPLTDRLQHAFSAHASELPEATQAALLVAALDDGATLREVLTADRLLMNADVTVETLTPALDGELITIEGDRVRFRHPLIRSAIEEAAPPSRRRETYRALAAAVVDPDRRAWHRASSVLGTDDDAAADLEATASRAQDRGATGIALRAVELAANLTSDGALRARRLLAAAELAFQLGQPAAVRRLLDAAGKLPVTPNDVARMTWLREIFNDGVPGDAAAITRLVDIARETASGGDRHLALNLLLAAGLRCWWAEAGQPAREMVVQAVDQIDTDRSDPRTLQILSLASPVDEGGRVSELVAHAALAADLDATRIQVLGFAADAAGDYGQSLTLLNRAAPGLRTQGKLALVAQLLVVRASTEIHVGQFRDANRDADEGYRLAVETEQPIWIAGGTLARALLAALSGQETLAEQLAVEAEAAIHSLHISFLFYVVQLARGLAAMTAGRPSEAFDHFARIFAPGDMAFSETGSYTAGGYVIECAVRAERHDEARQLLRKLEALGRRTPAPLLHLGLRFGRALLAEESEAEALYEVALAAEPKWPFDYARLQLAYGRWLRHQRRITESRPYLRTARDTFEALGVHAWADKARVELRASGERVKERAKPPQQPLSPQELQIAQMAASGLSNREIADRLFLSHRTVGAHLYRVYPKLGIVSRSELAGALATTEPAVTR